MLLNEWGTALSRLVLYEFINKATIEVQQVCASVRPSAKTQRQCLVWRLSIFLVAGDNLCQSPRSDSSSPVSPGTGFARYGFAGFGRIAMHWVLYSYHKVTQCWS